jgi:hypothetical protein
MGGGRGISAIFDALADQAVFGCLALLLALVFVASAVPKLRKPELAALAIVDFGVTRRAYRQAGLGLGVAEFILAIALAVSAAVESSARAVPAACAVFLLWAFVGLIARALRSPERFSCQCFGSSDPVSTTTLIRTVSLAVAATLLLISAFGSVATPTAEQWFLELAIAASALGIAALSVRLPDALEVPHGCA